MISIEGRDLCRPSTCLYSRDIGGLLGSLIVSGNLCVPKNKRSAKNGLFYGYGTSGQGAL